MSGQWTIYRSLAELVIIIGQEESIGQIVDAMSNRSILITQIGASHVTQLYPSSLGTLIIHKHSSGRCTIEYQHHYNGTVWRGGYYKVGDDSNNGWYDWQQLVNTEQPTKNDLPVASGMTITDEGYFYKDQFDVVHVCGMLIKDSAMASGNILATLPTGYRPVISIQRPATYSPTWIGGTVNILTNGRITVASTLSGQTAVCFDLEFLAT